MAIWYAGVTGYEGARDPIMRNEMISQLRKKAESSNVGNPGLIVILVPDGSQDSVMDRLVPVLNEHDYQEGLA